MAEGKITISIMEFDKVKALFEAMIEEFDELPENVKEKLMDLQGTKES